MKNKQIEAAIDMVMEQEGESWKTDPILSKFPLVKDKGPYSETDRKITRKEWKKVKRRLEQLGYIRGDIEHDWGRGGGSRVYYNLPDRSDEWIIFFITNPLPGTDPKRTVTIRHYGVHGMVQNEAEYVAGPDLDLGNLKVGDTVKDSETGEIISPIKGKTVILNRGYAAKDETGRIDIVKNLLGGPEIRFWLYPDEIAALHSLIMPTESSESGGDSDAT